jgi:drug/metabolite transporter (DMT)-like permease|tara:strand:- start:197 stop:448 length:252 start_codon:yes stop_codon:yes gene_type:complete
MSKEINKGSKFIMFLLITISLSGLLMSIFLVFVIMFNDSLSLKILLIIGVLVGGLGMLLYDRLRKKVVDDEIKRIDDDVMEKF